MFLDWPFKFCLTTSRPTLSTVSNLRGGSITIGRKMTLASSFNYEEAVSKLNTLQTNAAVLDKIRETGGRTNITAIPEMKEYLSRIGYKPSDLNSLNLIHVTGTNGKGSTCAFCESILLNLPKQKLKVGEYFVTVLVYQHPYWYLGLYTSPHLMAVRERIRIDGKPLSETLFAKYFAEVWNRLQGKSSIRFPDLPARPVYFRFLTLLAFHVFIMEKVDVAIIEVGIGGEYDSTNIIERPKVTGVSSLDFDHTAVLGNTLSSIAWNKAGIFKPGAPAFTIPQPKDGLDMLMSRAKEKRTSLTIVHTPKELDDIRLGKHQKSNAALSIALCRTLISSISFPFSRGTVPVDFLPGLENAKWPGRCQTLSGLANGARWHLDGAHTSESLRYCLEWFKSVTRPNSSKTLVFNSTGNREVKQLINVVKDATADSVEGGASFFDNIIFCTNITFANGESKNDLILHNSSSTDIKALKPQRLLAEAWLDHEIEATAIPKICENGVNLYVLPTIEDAVNVIGSISSGVVAHDVLVTGSLHLVGGVMTVLNYDMDGSE